MRPRPDDDDDDDDDHDDDDDDAAADDDDADPHTSDEGSIQIISSSDGQKSWQARMSQAS